MGKKRKPKPNAAQRELAASWEKMKTDHKKPLERGAVSKGVGITQDVKSKKRQALTSMPHVTGHERVSPLQDAKSVGDQVGNATKSKDKVYTGDKMLGIGQLHKSNSVPVFRQEDAVDIAKMRRN